MLLISLILFSCNIKQENKTTDKASLQVPLAPLQVTVIANLHDSLQPRVVSLDTMPKPLIVAIPNKSGGSYTKINYKGEVIKINILL